MLSKNKPCEKQPKWLNREFSEKLAKLENLFHFVLFTALATLNIFRWVIFQKTRFKSMIDKRVRYQQVPILQKDGAESMHLSQFIERATCFCVEQSNCL